MTALEKAIAKNLLCVAFALVAICTLPSPSSAQRREIDVKTSTVTVNVFKGGLFSAFGHDHEISTRIASGAVDAAGRSVEWSTHADSLRVVDPNSSEKDRAEVQKNMLSPEVLDVEHYAEISFRSTNAEAAGAGAWHVRGDLTLHGQTKPVIVEVREKAGHYVGTARLKQTDFG